MNKITDTKAMVPGHLYAAFRVVEDADGNEYERGDELVIYCADGSLYTEDGEPCVYSGTDLDSYPDFYVEQTGAFIPAYA